MWSLLFVIESYQRNTCPQITWYQIINVFTSSILKLEAKCSCQESIVFLFNHNHIFYFYEI